MSSQYDNNNKFENKKNKIRGVLGFVREGKRMRYSCDFLFGKSTELAIVTFDRGVVNF